MFKSPVCPIELGTDEGTRRMWREGGSRGDYAPSCSWSELAITPTSLLSGHFLGLPLLGALQKPCWAESALCLCLGHSSTIEMLESSQDRGRFSDVRESMRELPTPLSLPSSSSRPAASWAALAGPACRPHGHTGFWVAPTAPTTAAPWDREKDPGSGRGAAGAGRERGRL